MGLPIMHPAHRENEYSVVLKVMDIVLDKISMQISSSFSLIIGYTKSIIKCCTCVFKLLKYPKYQELRNVIYANKYMV